MKKLLYLTFYFRPDLCAGSFRNSALFDELVRKAGEDVEITVLTTAPNRYATFAATAEAEEKVGEHKIIRFPLPHHKSGFVDQAKSFYAYARQVQKWIGQQKFDGVFASSSRLFTAWLGARVARKQKIPLYLDMRDIFSENIAEILGDRLPVRMLKVVLHRVEKYTFNTAKHINLVSQGFEPYFSQFKGSSRSFFTNGIDDVFLEGLSKTVERRSGPKRIVYAGNMGEGQGLHAIVPQAAEQLGDAFEFRLFGDGGRKATLVEEVERRNLKNVHILNPINRSELIEEYLQADYLFLHLNNYKAFELVIPSKVFEYGASDKPIFAGVAGYPAEFIRQNIQGAFVFPPLDSVECIQMLRNAVEDKEDREEFRKKFSRKNICAEMSSSLLKVLFL